MKNTLETEVVVRFAQASDAPVIVNFIKELARYEKMPEAATASSEEIAIQMQSMKPPFECLLAEIDNVAIGFALFFQNYSTWQGQPGLFLEDLFVQEEYRGRGIGTKLLKKLADVCIERDYGRMEWEVMPWIQPALEFYASIGSEILDKKKCRLAGDALMRLSRSKDGDGPIH